MELFVVDPRVPPPGDEELLVRDQDAVGVLVLAGNVVGAAAQARVQLADKVEHLVVPGHVLHRERRG